MGGGEADESPVVGDLDSDGDIDLVWPREGGGIVIQLNDGTGTFTTTLDLATPPISLPVVADFNNDGRPDIVAPLGGAFRSQVLVFLNTCDQPPADLAVTLQGPTAPVLEGSDFTYNIAVTNSGPNPATGVQLDFSWGPIADLVSVGGSENCTIDRSRLTCPLGTLNVGTSAITVVVRPRSGGTLSSRAGVTGTTSDPNAANNAAFVETTITPGASKLVVNNTNDSGPGSLFQAIFDSNDPGPRDTITFNIPGAGPHTIRPTTRNLPDIVQPVVIDATTQTGFTANGPRLIEISGENAGSATGLFINTSNTLVRGLAINRFAFAGIGLNGPGGHTLEGNFIGTNPAGTAALPNLQQGIFVNSPNNVIGGTTAAARNVISGNQAQGLFLVSGANGNVVAGNYIGTNVDGTAALGNAGAGIAIQSSGNTVGGTAPGSRNVISGNNGGVNINGTTAIGNQVLGNFIGTNASGNAAVPNGNNGINISNGATNTTVGGSSAAARNIISGNVQSGVRIQNVGTTGNNVRGNYVGTNAAGSATVPNGLNGVEFGFAATGNMVGGTQPADGNVISGNAAVGLAFFTAGTGGNQALFNLIGTDATGTQPLGNGSHGVFMQSNNNRLGSLTSSIGNVIAFNGAYGVRVDTGTGNAIVNNSIFSNGLMGIDLVPGGLTPNDAGDTDTGSNTLINWPVLSSARTVGANVLVQVALSPTPVGQFQVHFYANAACDQTGNGEGQTLIGVSSGTGNGTDANLEASFPSSLVPAGSFITATMTDSAGNTSEFSPCAQVAPDAGTANLSISKQDSPDPATVGSPLTYTIAVSNLGPDAATNVTVTDTLPANVTFVSASASIGSCSGTTTVTCVIGTIANGANVSIGIVVTPTATGTLTNTTTVTGAGTDPVSANNSATATTTVTPAVPATFVVTTTLDNGAGSLRQAILDANAHIGPDSITFAIIAGSGVRSIVPATALPTITSPVTIDGTSQTGFNGTPLIELNGSQAGSASGLVLNTSDSLIRGLIINRFANGNGIFVQTSATNTNNRIEGNWVGLDSTGNGAAANNFGIRVQSPGNTVGGATAAARNVVSGNTGSAITVQGTTASGNTVQGNYVGTNVTGNAPVPNQGVQSGIFILNAPNNTIGGTSAGSGNVISGNALHALTLVNTSGNVILGNLIGTEPNGVTPLGNGGIGLDIVTSSSNTVGGAGMLAILCRTTAQGCRSARARTTTSSRTPPLRPTGSPSVSTMHPVTGLAVSTRPMATSSRTIKPVSLFSPRRPSATRS